MFTTLDLNSGSSPHADAATTSRPKRSQVRRACDWCKLMRIKCDNDRPCYNCQQGGRECGMSSRNQFRSLAAAVKEVETLRAQVRELETIKKRLVFKLESTSPKQVSPSSSVSLFEPLAVERPSGLSNGVCVGPILYGMASLPSFLTRMDQFLRTTRPQLDLDICSSTRGIHSPPRLTPDSASVNYMPPDQELHSLALFWQSHYFSFPILNEGQFRREYQSLLSDSAPGAPRKASPLVDIMLALCIQLASFVTCTTSDFRPDDNVSDSCAPEYTCPSLAGFQYYLRCQEALDQTVESPSIVTVQCYIFSIVYLYEAGFLNRAQVVAGKAIMTAIILGLPNEPQSSEPEPQRELARRTWWSLYALDAKLSMEAGRSPMIGSSFSNCHLPSDSIEMAEWLAPHYRHDDHCPPWLGFQTQTLGLLRAIGAVRSAFYNKYNEVVGENGYMTIVSNGVAREECAHFLIEQMKNVDDWAKQVPKGYYVPRKEGQPFTTDHSTLDLRTNPNILIHCQRQRLLLELQYYQQCMSLYQVFICFASTSDMSTPLGDSNAAAGLNHAIALTNMIHQAMTTSGALSGVYHVFRWQKNALFTMIGYAYTFPLSHSRATIRKTIEMAIAVIDMYRDVLSEASSVASIARALAYDLGVVINGFYAASSWSPSSSSSPLVSLAEAANEASTATLTALDEASSNNNQELVMSAPTATPPQQQQQQQRPPSNRDELLDFSSLDINTIPEMGDRQINWDPMEMLWANLDPGEGSAADSWDLVTGDVV